MGTKKNITAYGLLLSFLALFVFPDTAFSWPIESQWIPTLKYQQILQDPNSDAQGSRNVVSLPGFAAAYMYNDFEYIHFRLRLDKDPTGTGGQGLLQPYGWGVELDTNFSAGDYEWLLMLDGISQAEVVSLQRNTTQSTLGDPGDQTESICSNIPLSGNFRIIAADTSINGDPDYYLDWRFPWTTFKQCTGSTEQSPIRLFFGSSSSANNLTERGADLVGASDLYAGFSDYLLAGGTRPTTGIVWFVDSLTGTTDINLISAGDTLYIRVEDLDQNYNPATLQTVIVTVSVSGDIETLVLTETGVNTGIFSSTISTAATSPVLNDGTLQLQRMDTLITVTYVDVIDALFNLNQNRNDTVSIVLPPTIVLTKTVDKASCIPGDILTYTIVYRNIGGGPAHNLIIADSIPLFTTYMTDSLKIGNAASTYATATVLTDAADADAGQVNGAAVIFTVNTVAGDDGVVNAGNDEGKVYFKVKIN